MPAAKQLPKHLSDLPPATPGKPGTPGSSANAAALPGVPGPMRRVEPIRSQAEYESIPGIDVAVGFAEALNMGCVDRLTAVMSEGVQYHSEWIHFRTRGRDRVRRLFLGKLNRVLLSIFDEAIARYGAQIIILPDGQAAVLTETYPDKGTALTTFTIANGRATHLFVTPRFDRRELRETGYFPPAA